jgi:hypothetical protein
MSSSQSVDFASFPISSEDPRALRAEFTEFCCAKAVESASDPNSPLANSCEFEYFIYEYGEGDCSNINDFSPLMLAIQSSIEAGTSIRSKYCSDTSSSQPYLEVRTGSDEGVSFDMYLWILKCCLEFSHFALEKIDAYAAIDDSSEGRSVLHSEYSLADF